MPGVNSEDLEHLIRTGFTPVLVESLSNAEIQSPMLDLFERKGYKLVMLSSHDGRLEA